MKQPTPEACAACVGLDWAAAQHAVCRQAAGTAHRECLRLAQSPGESQAWGQTLRTRFHGQPVAVCLALPKGPIGSARRHADCLGLFPVKPLTVARDRDAFPPRRAQDAPTAAALQGALLLTHRDQRTPLPPQSPARRPRTPLVAPRRRLVGDQVRGTHRFTRALKHSFPQVLQWFPEKDPAIFGDVLRRWSPRTAAPRARRSPLAGCFRAHHVRSADVIDTRRHASKRAMARTTDDGVITPHGLLVPALVAPLRVTWQAMADCDTAMAPRAQEHPAFPLFDAVPGAGAVFAPRLLVAVGAQRERCTSADALQKYAGMAPVTARRGKQAWGHWRRQGPTCLRQTCVAWAAQSPRHAFWAQVSYPQQRDQGKAPQAAVRA